MLCHVDALVALDHVVGGEDFAVRAPYDAGSGDAPARVHGHRRLRGLLHRRRQTIGEFLKFVHALSLFLSLFSVSL